MLVYQRVKYRIPLGGLQLRTMNAALGYGANVIFRKCAHPHVSGESNLHDTMLGITDSTDP